MRPAGESPGPSSQALEQFGLAVRGFCPRHDRSRANGLALGDLPLAEEWRVTNDSQIIPEAITVLVVDDDSFETATRVGDLDPGLPVDDLERIEGVTDSIADALDASWLESLPSSSRPRRAQPRSLPVPAGRAGPRRRRVRGPARGNQASHPAGRGRVRRAGHRAQRAAGTARPGGRAGPRPRAAAARRHHRGRPAEPHSVAPSASGAAS